MESETSPPGSRGRPGYLSIQGAGKTYNPGRDATVALRNVSFEVGGGEFVSILGASGCGKSTLLMMVCGLEPITAGRIFIGGEAVARPRPDVGIIFQDATLLPWQTALQNVLFPIEIMRRSIAEYRPKAEELLALVGLKDFMHRKPAQLSGGMRQRVAICRALVHNRFTAPAGRAVQRARRDHARRAQCGAARHLGALPADRGVRDPQHPRGGVPLRSRHRPWRAAAGGGRRRAGAVRASAALLESAIRWNSMKSAQCCASKIADGHRQQHQAKAAEHGPARRSR